MVTGDCSLGKRWSTAQYLLAQLAHPMLYKIIDAGVFYRQTHGAWLQGVVAPQRVLVENLRKFGLLQAGKPIGRYVDNKLVEMQRINFGYSALDKSR